VSGEILRKQNDKLYLRAILFDRTDNFPLRCFCQLYDSTNTLYNTLEIPHVGDGVFWESSELMPNQEMVTARFNIYENDGVTLSTNHVPAEDRYMLDVTGQIVENNLDATISSISSGGGQDNIEGLISGDSAIEGEIDTETLEGTMEINSNIEGVVDEC
jgi:hypothetical protein